LSWPNVATADPARIAVAHWQPGENYGIAAKPSNLIILDLDRPKPGYKLPAEWLEKPGIVDGQDVLADLAERAGQPWPGTFTVETPSGGWHLYYRAPSGRTIGNRPAGPLIDVRGGGAGHGGYVLGPGSALNGRTYRVVNGQAPEVLPPWIADLLDPPRAAQRRGLSLGEVSGTAYGRLRGIVEAILTSREGTRNTRLHWAACRGREMVTAGQADRPTVERVLIQAAVEVGLTEREATRTVTSGLGADR
jgi:hypothetical protein